MTIRVAAARMIPYDATSKIKLARFTGNTWECSGSRSTGKWERRRQWYEDNGYLDRLITSEDGLDGSIDAAEIERIARKKILLED